MTEYGRTNNLSCEHLACKSALNCGSAEMEFPQWRQVRTK